jgi:hypothetical protein
MILDQYLKKLGLKNFSELNTEEKETFKSWEEALSGRKLTDKDVSEWLEYELNTAIGRMTEVDLPPQSEIFRKMEVKFIKKIQGFLNSPKVEKAFAEKSIEQLMNK